MSWMSGLNSGFNVGKKIYIHMILLILGKIDHGLNHYHDQYYSFSLLINNLIFNK